MQQSNLSVMTDMTIRKQAQATVNEIAGWKFQPGIYPAKIIQMLETCVLER